MGIVEKSVDIIFENEFHSIGTSSAQSCLLSRQKGKIKGVLYMPGIDIDFSFGGRICHYF